MMCSNNLDRRTNSLVFSLALGLWLLCINVALAQPPADDHTAHHPQPGDSSDTATASSEVTPFPPAMDPAVMEQMMERMGVPPPRDLYPTLMSMEEISEENRVTALDLARERLDQGLQMIAEANLALSAATERNDLLAMEEATAQFHQGMSRYQTGLAAIRLLQEGQPPQSVALEWFKSEMNLLPTTLTQDQPLVFGMTPFHTSIMAILLLFAIFTAWMYGFKMRRAGALLSDLAAGRITADTDAFSGILTHPREAPGNQNPTTPLSRRETWIGKLKVIGIFPETPQVKTFRLAMPGSSPLPFAYEPGQFATLTLYPEQAPDGVKRSYTIASSPSQRDYVELTIKREPEGLCSRFMHDNVSVGDELQLQAPLGRFYFNGTTSERILLVAGGVGITPMMSALRYLTAHCWPGQIRLLFGVKTPEDIIFKEEIERLTLQFENVKTDILVSQPGDSQWEGRTGRITTEVIQELIPDVASFEAHICGPPAMMDAVKSSLMDLGVPKAGIKTEAFGTEVKRNLATSPRPVDIEQGTQFAVSFTQSKKNAAITPDQTVLDAADAVDVPIDRSCLAGTCGACIVKLASGEVNMEVEDALEPEEKEAGYILACQAKPKTDISVDA